MEARDKRDVVKVVGKLNANRQDNKVELGIAGKVVRQT